MKKIIIYTDGSCLGNPGSGGWAAILKVEGTDARRELAGGFSKTTNNRMEIISVLEALKQLREPCEVSIFSDSQYVCNTISKGWIYGWHRHGWIKSDKQPVKNVNLGKSFSPFCLSTKSLFTGYGAMPDTKTMSDVTNWPETLLAKAHCQKTRDFPVHVFE